MATNPLFTVPQADKDLSTAEKIKASAARLEKAYGDQELNATKSCPLEGGPDIPPHGGNCKKCGQQKTATSHSLPRTPEAEAEAAKLHKQITDAGNLGGVPLERLFKEDDETAKGNMIGVLLCVDANGETQVLRAFSGAINGSGKYEAPGFCPPLPTSDPDFPAWQRELNELPDKIEAANADAKRKMEARDQAALDNDQKQKLANVQNGITAIYKDKTKTKEEKQAAARDLLSQKAEIEKLTEAEDTAYKDALQKLNAQRAREKVLEKKIDEELKKRVLTNFEGDSKAMPDVVNAPDEDTAKAKLNDGRLGNCAAPKMIAQAHAMGLTPVSIAEIWIGKDKGKQTDFGKDPKYVESCDCCRSILGFSLCGLESKQKSKKSELDKK